MTTIQFDEDQEFSRSPEVTQTPLFVRLVLKTGIVSTQKQAEYVLLGLAISGFIIIGIILMTGNKATGLSTVDIQRITQLQQGNNPSSQ